MVVKTVQALAVLLIACTLCIPAAAASTVSLEYYHMDRCSDCRFIDPLIADLEGAYDGASQSNGSTSRPWKDGSDGTHTHFSKSRPWLWTAPSKSPRKR